MQQTYVGRYRFPGIYAFLEKPDLPNYLLLQFDDPFTGAFNEAKAEATCNSLHSNHQNGDPANLSGDVVTCDVKGRPTPVLFLFG